MNTNLICWCEIYVDDIERGKTCYSDVSGTQFHDIPAVEGNGGFKRSIWVLLDLSGC